MSRFTHPTPKTAIEQHLSYPVLREWYPIELAKIPINGDQLQDSIILHPRYVPKSVEHELLSVRTSRRGRALDIFLDEPVEINSIKYGILNFKGVGADADYPLTIHPDNWFNQSREWIDRRYGDSHNRVWGALTRDKSRREFPARIFHQYGIKHAPHLALNPVPSAIYKEIQRVHGGKEKHNLVQLVRALRTNIRADDMFGKRSGGLMDVTAEEIAEIDSTLINAQLKLAGREKMLCCIGNIEDNRFIDGYFTDAENYYIDNLERHQAASLLHEIIWSSLERILVEENTARYFECIQEKTGLAISRDRFMECGEELLELGMEKAVNGKARKPKTRPILQPLPQP